MTIRFADRIKESGTVTGTGNVTLTGSTTGYRAFSDVFNNNEETYVCLQTTSGAMWEVNRVTYDQDNNALIRSQYFLSSSTGALIDFPAASTIDVSLVDPAALINLLGQALCPIPNVDMSWDRVSFGNNYPDAGLTNFFAIGSNNDILGDGVVIGNNNTLDTNGYVVGSYNTLSGSGSIIIAANSIVNTNIRGAYVFGRKGKAYNHGQFVFADGDTIPGVGSAQVSQVLLSNQSYNGVLLYLATGGTGSGGGTFNLLPNKLYGVTASIIGRHAPTTDCFHKVVTATIKTAADTYTLLGGTVTLLHSTFDSGASLWAANLYANDQGLSLRVGVTGQISKLINWVCHATLVEVT